MDERVVLIPLGFYIRCCTQDSMAATGDWRAAVAVAAAARNQAGFFSEQHRLSRKDNEGNWILYHMMKIL